MRRLFTSFAVIFSFSLMLNAQTQDFQLGSGTNRINQNNVGFYDLSDPQGLNMKVSVWGVVRFPGRYIIPANSSVSDLLSYAGGPTLDSYVDEMKLIRTLPDSSIKIIKLQYEDILWDRDLKGTEIHIPVEAGDVLLVPGVQRWYFKDYLQISLSILSALISVSILFFK